MAIALIGFMGCGKTTVGKLLAKELNFNYVDTDNEIEKKYGSIVEIFSEHGEAYFREIESKVLKQISYNNIVLATGGGIVLNPENIQIIKQNLKIVWLKVELNDIIKRLQNDTTRPLFKQNPQLKELFIYRESLYEKYADFIVNNKDLNQTISVVKNYVFSTLS